MTTPLSEDKLQLVADQLFDANRTIGEKGEYVPAMGRTAFRELVSAAASQLLSAGVSTATEPEFTIAALASTSRIKATPIFEALKACDRSGITLNQRLTVDDVAELLAHVMAERLALLAAPQPSNAPTIKPGFVQVPLRMTAAMQRLVAEGEWEWADLLAAAEAVTEDEYFAATNSPFPDDWHLAETPTHYELKHHHGVIATLRGPDSEAHAKIIAHLFTRPPVAGAAAKDRERLDLMTKHRISLVPEFEGDWDAARYTENGEVARYYGGCTPRAALDAVLADIGKAAEEPVDS